MGLRWALRCAGVTLPVDQMVNTMSAVQLLPGQSPAVTCCVVCREVLAKLREWEATIKACQALGRDPLDTFELNFRFVGSPGASERERPCTAGLE